jgi:hypothetical protein
MPRTLRMPSEAELPKGPVRDFVNELFLLYRMARRPTLREISSAISQRDDLPGTASTETIRRMLRGSTVPAHWPTVDAVLIVLCEMAGTDPDQEFRSADGSSSWREDVLQAWHEALDNPDGRYVQPAPDPWSEDPPF